MVGCGHMGAHHARTVAAAPGCELVAVVDVVAERARRLGASVGAPASAAVPPDAELVIVATPTASHVEVALPHLRRGRWCLIEKPLAPTAAMARALVHPRAVVGHIERHNPQWRPPPDGWRELSVVRRAPPTGRATDIDALADLLVHDVDLLRSLGLPAPAVAVPVVLRDEAGRIQAAEVVLRWRDGRCARLAVSRRAPVAERSWTVQSGGGRLVRDLTASLAPGPDPLSRQLAAVLAAVVGGGDAEPAALAAVEGVRALEWVDAIRSVARRGAVTRRRRGPGVGAGR